jgi:hypothetical protein
MRCLYRTPLCRTQPPAPYANKILEHGWRLSLCHRGNGCTVGLHVTRSVCSVLNISGPAPMSFSASRGTPSSLRARVSYSSAIILNPLSRHAYEKSRPPGADTGRHDPIRLVFPGPSGKTVQVPKGCSTGHPENADMIKSSSREKAATFLSV